MPSQIPQKKLPVILVHGYLSIPLFNLPLKAVLRSHGFKVFMLDLPFLNLFTSVERIGELISQGVDEILAREQVNQCNMVGVSLGGITGLYYLKKLKGNQKVRTFISYGAPLRGTWGALAALPFFGLVSKSSWQMLPAHPLLKELTESPVDSTQVVSLYAENDPLAGPHTAKLDWTENLTIPSFPISLLAHQAIIFSRKALKSVITILESQTTGSR